MDKFISHQGQAIPLRRANVDTDVIIRMDRCATFPRNQLGPWAFESLRIAPDGTLDPACVFNNHAFQHASILVASDNFGCGSSREMAVWALAGMGLRCVIAPGFGDIFYANCFQNSLLPVRLPAATVDALLTQATDGSLTLEVNLLTQTITGATDGTITFDIEPLRKSMLLEGLDEISITLTHSAAITQWQERDRTARPWVYAALNI
ncbi:3-isopropylmalate dehydratase small subunit [Polaromonas sp.]|uniref:3-isopropylmalate dehydratase small subunit n=1 Tax=Polaromonas sp. TaxID=1869339 RepID=UPI003265080E